jgi:hypothetical protein
MSPETRREIVNDASDQCCRLVGELDADLRDLCSLARVSSLPQDVRERGVGLVRDTLTRAQSLLEKLQETLPERTRSS